MLKAGTEKENSFFRAHMPAHSGQQIMELYLLNMPREGSGK